MNSRVTYDADNLLIASLNHKHPHELLGLVVKERLAEPFVSTEAAHSTAASHPVKLFSNLFSSIQTALGAGTTTALSSGYAKLTEMTRVATTI